jgi:23S rRNA (guanosine2251-2'-O)-methyltransferase
VDLILGINPVLEALAAASRHFDRLLIVKGLRNRRVAEAVSRASRQGIPLRFESRETLDRLSGNLPHQGIVAVVSPKPVLGLEELLATARDPALVVVLDGVEDPRNLGAVLRSAEAAGADGVVLPERHSAGLSETVGRASAGALEHVRVARVGNLVAALEALKARGLWIVGFDGSGTERWDAVDYRRPVALVLGGEGRGIRRLVKEHCDHLVAVPLFGQVASLNVSVAAGIGLYEVVRQRGAVPSHVRPIPSHPAHGSVTHRAESPGPGESPGHGPEEAAAETPEEAPLSVVRIEDDHWSGGPTVLVRRPQQGGRHGRPGPRRTGAGAPPPGSEGRRGRRRRKPGRAPGGPGGPPGPAAPPPEPAAPQPAARPTSGENGQAVGPGGGQPGPPRRRGRRGRRKR